MRRLTVTLRRTQQIAVRMPALGLLVSLMFGGIALASTGAWATPSAVAPNPPPSSPSASVAAGAASRKNLDAATREALALEDTIELAEQDADALKQRIEATNLEVLRQESTLNLARTGLEEAERRFEGRLVRMYKAGVESPLLVLVSAESISDLWSGITLLSRVISEDTAAYRDAQVASAEAEYQAGVLDDLRAQLVQFRELQDRRLDDLRTALTRQRLLVATLSAASKQLVVERQASAKRSRAEWRSSSIPWGTKIPFAPAVVEPYRERTYLVASYQPKRYRTTGKTFTAVCSWYGGIFNGRGTASGQIYNMDDLTCASRTLPFGTRIALTRGSRRVIVVVTDRGPFVAGRDLDLSRAAARTLDFWGVARIEAEFVDVATGAAR